MPIEPLRDSVTGEVIPHDHPGIPGDSKVIRRISELQIITDVNGVRKISSLAYGGSTGPAQGMSVDLEFLILEAGLQPHSYVTTPRWFGSVWFAANALRAEALQIGTDPLPDNPFHGQVWGDLSRRKKRRLRDLAEWYVPVPGVQLRD